MNGDSSHLIAEIRTAIEKGTLTHSEIERRLEAAIEAEIEKDDSPADSDLFRACQSLLWELDTHGSKAFVDDTEQALAVFKAKRGKATDMKHGKLRFAYRMVAAAATILLIAFGVDVLFNREWLVGNSTDDQQQYIISGQKIDPGIVSEGQADDRIAPLQEITTKNLDEAIEVLGFTPAMPQWIPDGWELFSYYVSKTESSKWFIITYEKPEQEYYLLYQINFFDDAERASAAFEQNKTGAELVLLDGKSIYMSENYDDTTCVWYDDLACYNLMGPESRDTFIAIIESIKERE